MSEDHGDDRQGLGLQIGVQRDPATGVAAEDVGGHRLVRGAGGHSGESGDDFVHARDLGLVAGEEVDGNLEIGRRGRGLATAARFQGGGDEDAGWIDGISDPVDEPGGGPGPVVPTVGEGGSAGVLAIERQAGGGLLEGIAVVEVAVLALERLAHDVADLALEKG